MTSLSRRLKHLEASYQSVNRLAGERARNLESVIMKRVLQHLSDYELCLLRDVAAAMLQGAFEQSEMPAEQWAALNKAYDAALDEECRNAGFTSMRSSTDAAGVPSRGRQFLFPLGSRKGTKAATVRARFAHAAPVAATAKPVAEQ